MRGHVSKLKEMVHAIDDERKQQGELLDIMVRRRWAGGPGWRRWAGLVDVVVCRLWATGRCVLLPVGRGCRPAAAAQPNPGRHCRPRSSLPRRRLTRHPRRRPQSLDMERARAALHSARKRLNVAYHRARSNHMLFLLLFVVALVTGVYALARIYRLGRAITG
jgi:hypothetical protein